MIILAGVVGSGKSTISKRLSDALGTKLMMEPVDTNPILDKYYADPEKYGYLLQMYFLNQRYEMIVEALNDRNNVLDRSIYEDKLFAKINTDTGSISQLEYETYCHTHDILINELKKHTEEPDLLVYLDVDFDKMLSNIVKRGRDYEQFSQNDELYQYYKRMHDEYKTWYDEYNHSAKVKIDMNKYDVNQDRDWNIVFGIIKDALDKRDA